MQELVLESISLILQQSELYNRKYAKLGFISLPMSQTN